MVRATCPPRGRPAPTSSRKPYSPSRANILSLSAPLRTPQPQPPVSPWLVSVTCVWTPGEHNLHFCPPWTPTAWRPANALCCFAVLCFRSKQAPALLPGCAVCRRDPRGVSRMTSARETHGGPPTRQAAPPSWPTGPRRERDTAQESRNSPRTCPEPPVTRSRGLERACPAPPHQAPPGLARGDAEGLGDPRGGLRQRRRSTAVTTAVQHILERLRTVRVSPAFRRNEHRGLSR